MRYLIWSCEHRGWWMAGGWGYSTATHKAGIFREEEARKIVDNANRFRPKDDPNEIMLPAPNPALIELDRHESPQIPSMWRGAEG